MDESDQRLYLYQPAVYRIQVQGQVGKDWADWFGGMAVAIDKQACGPSITTLTGIVVDQAALQGLLSKLYNLGLPLVSVQHIGKRETQRTGE
jgi:hypothetical protein